MRTLQEKYNGIQEGKFSKENFLADARRELPNLVTRFNGYDDAVQILKNKGMIQEARVEEVKLTEAKVYSFTLTYNDAKYVQRVLDDAGVDAVAKAGTFDDEVVVRAFDGMGLRRAKQALEADHFDINENIKEARLTKNSLTDYRYKPTNEMDKYPYEQILRGLRVELEVMEVYGTPTAEEYAKALAKVSKNLAKDSIFYTNQLAGVNPKVDLHDKMVDVTAKNTVDTFNGMKKIKDLKEDHSKNPDDKYTVKPCKSKGEPWAVWEGEKRVKGFATKEKAKEYADSQNKKQNLSESVLKEGIKNLIKKALMENEEGVYEMYGEESIGESAMGDIYQIAQEHDRFEHFVQAVEDEFGPVEDIAELEHIFNATRGEDEADDISHPRGYEEASDEESFEDLFESKLLKDLL